ncbi:hypothetical protein FNV43_RR20226 [Rhamnella rubrinervis]|uniref:Uncharacterized protein n=1 Tax=Rhamnella rubrinervis TaxID=2594499 RepID=A0A8K0GUE2_9ROSA|nr:hypothetical protein FNV43_RR20226 [Rhamnella rubrinervis]
MTARLKELDSNALQPTGTINVCFIAIHGTNKVEAITTYLDKTMEYSFEALSTMKRLRLLQFNPSPKADLEHIQIRMYTAFAFRRWFYELDDSDEPELPHNLQYLDWFRKVAENGLASLQTLSLVGCSKLEELLNNLEQLKSLRKLEIEDSVIEHLGSSAFLMENLESVSWDEERIESDIREKSAIPQLASVFSSLTFTPLTDRNGIKELGVSELTEDSVKIIALKLKSQLIEAFS